MNAHLYLSPLAQITAIGAEKVALSVAGRRFTVDDPAGMLKLILARAEQGLDQAAVCEELADQFPADAIEAAIQALVNTRVLIRHNTRASGDASLHLLEHRRELEALTAPASAGQYAPANWALALVGQGRLADALCTALGALGVTVDRLAEDADLPDYGQRRALLLVCADFEHHGLFRQQNTKAIARDLPTLFLGLDWSTVHCGPLVLPRASACYECYFHRLRTTRKFVAEFDMQSDPANLLYHALPSTLAIQFALAEGTRLILEYLSGTLDNLHHSAFSEIDSLTGSIGRSRVLRLPRCPACGTASSARPVGSVFQQALLRRRA